MTQQSSDSPAPDDAGREPAETPALRRVRDAYERTAASGSVRYRWCQPADGRPFAVSEGEVDFTGQRVSMRSRFAVDEDGDGDAAAGRELVPGLNLDLDLGIGPGVEVDVDPARGASSSGPAADRAGGPAGGEGTGQDGTWSVESFGLFRDDEVLLLVPGQDGEQVWQAVQMEVGGLPASPVGPLQWLQAATSATPVSARELELGGRDAAAVGGAVGSWDGCDSYDVVLDLARLPGAALEAAAGVFGLGGAVLPGRVALDEVGRVVCFLVQVPAGVSAVTSVAVPASSMRFDLFEHGCEVSIPAPEAAAGVPVRQFLASFEGVEAALWPEGRPG